MPGLVRQALRAHPESFGGPFATQTLAATIITAAHATLSGLPATGAEDAEEMSTLFLLVSIYLAVIIGAVTTASAVARQHRDIALVRAIGAAPWQVRRAVALQAAAIAVPAGGAGLLLGVPAAMLWIAALQAHGLAPDDARVSASLAAVPIVLGAGIGTALLGGLIAAARPARVRPAAAMAETAGPPTRTGGLRARLGVLLLAVGGIMSVVLSSVVPDNAGDTSVLVILVLAVGVGLLGPVLLGLVGRPVAALLRLIGGGPELLAAHNLPALSRRSGGALVPLVLVAAFATVILGARTTAEAVTGIPGSASDVWLDRAGTAVYGGFAAVAAVTTLVTLTISRRREFAVLRLAGATRGQVLRMVLAEGAVVTVTTALLAAAVGLVTLAPLLRATVGVTWPSLPVSLVVSLVVTVTVLVLFGTVGPVAAMARRPPVEAVTAP